MSGEHSCAGQALRHAYDRFKVAQSKRFRSVKSVARSLALISNSHRIRTAYECYCSGDDAKSVRLYEETLESCHELFGPEHQSRVLVTRTLAQVEAAIGAAAEAAILLEQAERACLPPSFKSERATGGSSGFYTLLGLNRG